MAAVISAVPRNRSIAVAPLERAAMLFGPTDDLYGSSKVIHGIFLLIKGEMEI
ncbi:hypothetical protein ACMDCR_28920 [Labrys okinawensis]|uniref:hypothetical protein n=1 Tax=Labrys okinawensis TaxID=346911 RepID=UPI0039BD826D